jgi:flagellar hook-associated protein FlgK
MASAIGSQLQNAQGGLQVQQSLLAQARNQRQQISGVDINEEAMVLVVEFQ